MAIGKAHAGGWEIVTIAIGSFLVSIAHLIPEEREGEGEI